MSKNIVLLSDGTGNSAAMEKSWYFILSGRDCRHMTDPTSQRKYDGFQRKMVTAPAMTFCPLMQRAMNDFWK